MNPAVLIAPELMPDRRPAEKLADELHELGFAALGRVHHNLTAAPLAEYAVQRDEAMLTEDGALLAYTGAHTGRSPQDKFIVRDAATEAAIDWGDINRLMSPAAFEALLTRMQEWAEGRDLFVQDLRAGAEAAHALPIRVVTQYAWHSLFARNMFLRPSEEQLEDHAPEFTVIDFPDFEAVPERDQTRSKTFVIVNFTRRLVLIGGTSYAGEIKKAIFTVMNHILPERGVMPMHASANIGAGGDVAVFFGLSGTGKTTLSADGARALIGDDEHGWSERGVFNFEGGCYAKAIKLNPQQEPEIYAAARRFGAVLENAVIDPDTRIVDFDSARFTENTRACYPIEFIPRIAAGGVGGMPQNIIMLTCDAFGVLPPLSRLSNAQAMYHFLSGYTARVAGTERGVTEPQAVFSACFGAPFLPRAPGVYAKLLGAKIARHDVRCWLVNTGWTGGGYGVGDRMPIDATRALIRAIVSGALEQAEFTDDGVFGLQIPSQVPGVAGNLLHPQRAWQDQDAYRAAARKLAGLFAENFKRFADQADEDVKAAAMRGA